MNILAISGSLRAASINSAFCRAAAQLAPAPMQLTVYCDLGSLPLFNPDLEENPPAAVQELRRLVAQASALVIASPEYAHGIAGAMKNALDWLVSYEAFVTKPIALINTSPRAHHAYDALAEVLLTMSGRLVPAACLSIPLLGTCNSEEAILASPAVSGAIRMALLSLANALTGDMEQFPNSPV